MTNLSMEQFDGKKTQLAGLLENDGFYTGTFALEGINFNHFSGMFQNLVKSVKSTMDFMGDFLKFDLVGKLSIEPKAFASTMKAIPYTTCGEMLAIVPEGMKGTFLEAISAVQKCVDHIPQGIRMLDEYESFLAQFISDKKFNTAAYDDKKVHANAEKIRHDLYTGVGKVFTQGSYKNKIKIKEVVKRNGDWEVIMQSTNEMIKKLEGIDRQAIQRKITQCSAYLEILAKDFEKEKDRKVSQEAAQRLGNMAQSVAREVEFFSMTYYRALSIRGGVQNTSELINSALG